MRTAGDRLITPLMILSLAFLVAGLHSLARSSPGTARGDDGGKGVQTRPAQSRPAGSSREKASPSEAQKPKKKAEKSGESRSADKPDRKGRSGATDASKASSRKDDKPLVFTDEDLKKFHHGSAPSVRRPAPPAAPAADPLKSLKDEQERARWRQEKIAKMQQQILDLEGKLKTLQQKRLSVVNPYVRRPAEGAEEKAEEKGMSGPELLARTDAEIKETSQELEKTRQDLATFLQNYPE